MQIVTYNILFKTGKGMIFFSSRIIVKYGDCYDTGKDEGYWRMRWEGLNEYYLESYAPKPYLGSDYSWAYKLSCAPNATRSKSTSSYTQRELALTAYHIGLSE